MFLFSAAAAKWEISNNYFDFPTCDRLAHDILQECGRVQQWLKGLLAHHVSVCMSSKMCLKWTPVCFSLYSMCGPCAAAVLEYDWLLRVKTQHSVNQDNSPPGRKEKAWGGVISTAHAPIWEILSLGASRKVIYFHHFCPNMHFLCFHKAVSYLWRKRGMETE